MAVLCLLTWVRAPGLLSQPRFWAEEATVFYSAALQEPAMASITHIPRGTAGYFLLSATGRPEWADEVKRWRSEPEYQPQVQPVLFPASGPQWRVAMPAPGSVPDPNEANRPSARGLLLRSSPW